MNRRNVEPVDVLRCDPKVLTVLGCTQRALGACLHLAPPGGAPVANLFEEIAGEEFCTAFATAFDEARRHCRKIHEGVRVAALRNGKQSRCECAAGLMHFAFPLIVNGVTVGVLQCYACGGSPRPFSEIAAELRGLVGSGDGAKSEWPVLKQLLSRKRAENHVAEGDAALAMTEVVAVWLSDYASRLPTEPMHPIPWQVSKALGLIETHYTETNFTARSASSLLGISATRLSQLFQLHLHATFSHRLAECRVTQSMERLRTTDETVLTVAHASGFAAISSFNRVFRKITGTSPSRWRDRAKQAAQ